MFSNYTITETESVLNEIDDHISIDICVDEDETRFDINSSSDEFSKFSNYSEDNFLESYENSFLFQEEDSVNLQRQIPEKYFFGMPVMPLMMELEENDEDDEVDYKHRVNEILKTLEDSHPEILKFMLMYRIPPSSAQKLIKRIIKLVIRHV